MKTKLFPLLSLFAAAGCYAPHVVGENQNQTGAITCATTTCNGTTVCVEDTCVQPSGSMCGGIGGLQCPSGQRCVDDPRDGCDWAHDVDCSGVCVVPPGDAGTTTTTDAGQPMSCGGHVANPQTCPMGYKCVDDPNSCSMAADCPGICVVDPNVITQCGGFTPFPTDCGAGAVCVNNPLHAGMEVDAPGICIKKQQCGGLAGLACPSGFDCVDDPSDGCDPNNGGADCNGFCTTHHGSGMCGGIAGIQCPGGLRCLDDPADQCDPNAGGADCSGICVP